MSFVQSEFLWFLVVVYALHWAAPARAWQNLVLAASSAVFYGWIHPWWLILLYTSAVLDFAMARLMRRAPRFKRLWLVLSLSANLGMLAYFKYANFFLESVITALQGAGVAIDVRTLNIVLPAGISFYTFQTMSYTIDVYRGELKPRKNLVDYLTFVTFFPQLVAGPIERATRLLPQLEVARRFSLEDLRAGIGLTMYGAFKKVVVADTLAPYVDKVFILEDPAGPLVLAATMGFMIQIYADFSGYTDMARGTGRMFGIDLVRNFDEPYLAASTPEFWQRWHMSLSRWIRDYLLAPLLGDVDRISRFRLAVAIMVTMVVMGAWHGAGWNYILFGVYHGLAIGLYIAAEARMPAAVRRIRGGLFLARAFHNVVVLGVGALIFREHSVARLVGHLGRSPFEAREDEWRVALGLVGVIAVLSIPGWAEHWVKRKIIPRLQGTVWFLPVESLVWSLYAVAIWIFHRDNTRDFIYFQF